MVTNVRAPTAPRDPKAPSRGEIVQRWLAGDASTDRFWMRTALSGYNGFNLIAADFQRGDCFYASNQRPNPERLERGLYGLSNGTLDSPWPKVEALKEATREALESCDTVDALAARLFDALADKTPAEDDELPSTGVSREWEKVLSSAFIRTADGTYGTRCSTLVITERVNKRLVTHVLERTFSPTGHGAAAPLHREGLAAPLHRGAATRSEPAGSGAREHRDAGAEPPGAAHPRAHAAQARAVAAQARRGLTRSGQSTHTISTWGMPTSSNTEPRGTNPERT